jgi:hypothetical protein
MMNDVQRVIPDLLSIDAKHRKIFETAFSMEGSLDERKSYMEEAIGMKFDAQSWNTIAELFRARRALEEGMTTGEIAKLTGFKPNRIRKMSDSGEMPPPAYRGQWRWWDRDEIMSWWREYSS